ncbi:hypothetical protein [Planctomycetes bacterium K23_9]|uniref:Uncharacterized protein n=1 Tax=Stieleria marina TaxID=1930275 RepID=A0A517NV78_9BACT|nr:hypothetical protein K239x_30210 [Planctomycetes bacterium K23_9]
MDATISSAVMFAGALLPLFDSLNVVATPDNEMEEGFTIQSCSGGRATIETAMIATKTSIERSRNCIHRVFIKRPQSKVDRENVGDDGARASDQAFETTRCVGFGLPIQRSHVVSGIQVCELS